MTIWLVLMLITGCSVAGLLIPLMRREPQTSESTDYDLAVYRDQLAEVEKDCASGLLPADQADAARAEIQRRILATEDAESVPVLTRESPHLRRLTIFAIIVLLPIGAMSLYAWLGVPGLPAQPYAERLRDDPYFAGLEALQRIAKQVKDHPTGKGYARLGDLYSILQRYGLASDAYREATTLEPGNAGNWSSLGESLVLMSNGEVAPDAQTAFTRAYALNNKDARAEFYLGLAAAQAQDVKHAVAIWRHLQQNSKPDAVWLPMVDQHIKAYSAKDGFDPASITPVPPIER